MLQDEQIATARDLLKRAGASESALEGLTDEELLICLDVVSDIFDDRAPDATWFRDFYTLLGDHMQLTEEGWIPADQNTREATGEEPMEVLDEVNVPTK